MKREGAQFVASEDWIDQTKVEDGSWWRALDLWLSELSTGKRSPGALPDTTLGAAPGAYVFG